MGEPQTSPTLENRIGPLVEVVPQFVPGTWRTSAELTTERRDNAALGNNWFWTANFSLYRVEGNDEVLYFGGREANPIFNNLEAATTQLVRDYNYRPNQESVDAVVQSVTSGHTLRVKLSDLALQGTDEEWRYFEINTTNYDRTLNPTQRAFAEHVYEQGDDFVKNMAMLKTAKITKTRIEVLNPEYVRENAKGGALARACYLDNNLNFGAVGRGILVYGGAVRGVPLANPYTTAYTTLLTNPQAAAQSMTPAIVDGIENIVRLYRTTPPK